MELRLLQAGGWPSSLALGASIAAILAIVGGAARWRWRRRWTDTLPASVVAQPPEVERVLSVVRVSAADLARAIAQRTDLVICDVRDPALSGLARDQGIVLYCTSPNEAAGAEAASLPLEGFILDRRTAGRPALDSPGRSMPGLG